MAHDPKMSLMPNLSVNQLNQRSAPATTQQRLAGSHQVAAQHEDALGMMHIVKQELA